MYSSWNQTANYQKYLHQTKAEEEKVSQNEIEKLLENLDTSKAPDPDDFHPHMLKTLAEELKEPVYLVHWRVGQYQINGKGATYRHY